MISWIVTALLLAFAAFAGWVAVQAPYWTTFTTLACLLAAAALTCPLFWKQAEKKWLRPARFVAAAILAIAALLMPVPTRAPAAQAPQQGQQ